MHVCMLTYSFYESDTRVRQYAKALAKRGDIVDVIALRRPSQESASDVDGVHVYRIQLRVPNERNPTTYLFRILRFFFRSAWLLARRNAASHYDVVHVHNVPDFLVFAAFVPRLTGARVILDIHDILPEFYASKFGADNSSFIFRLMVWVERLSIHFSDHVIIANDLWRKRLLSRSVQPDKCLTLINYPDLEVFVPRPHRTDGKFRIVYPGSLNRHQGLDIAVRAFARVAAEMPGAEFAIYGEGPDRIPLIRLILELEMDDRIHIHDSVAVSEIAAVMAESDLAVVPKRASSKFGNEAASTKIMEFMAVRVPLIASRTAIESHYFSDSLVKFFESENEADLAAAMLQMYREPQLRSYLVENASQYIAENRWDMKKAEYFELVDRARSCRSSQVGSGVRPASESARE